MDMWERSQRRTGCDLLLERLLHSPNNCLDVRAKIELMNAILLALDVKTLAPSCFLCFGREGLSSARGYDPISKGSGRGVIPQCRSSGQLGRSRATSPITASLIYGGTTVVWQCRLAGEQSR